MTMWWPCSTGEGQAADVWQHGRLWQGLNCGCCQAGDRLAAWQGVAWACQLLREQAVVE